MIVKLIWSIARFTARNFLCVSCDKCRSNNNVDDDDDSRGSSSEQTALIYRTFMYGVDVSACVCRATARAEFLCMCVCVQKT